MVSKRFRQRSSVLFPEPDGPMMESTSPRQTSREIPFSTSLSWKDLCMSRTRSIYAALFVVFSIMRLHPLEDCRQHRSHDQIKRARDKKRGHVKIPLHDSARNA